MHTGPARLPGRAARLFRLPLGAARSGPSANFAV